MVEEKEMRFFVIPFIIVFLGIMAAAWMANTLTQRQIKQESEWGETF